MNIINPKFLSLVSLTKEAFLSEDINDKLRLLRALQLLILDGYWDEETQEENLQHLTNKSSDRRFSNYLLDIFKCTESETNIDKYLGLFTKTGIANIVKLSASHLQTLHYLTGRFSAIMEFSDESIYRLYTDSPIFINKSHIAALQDMDETSFRDFVHVTELIKYIHVAKTMPLQSLVIAIHAQVRPNEYFIETYLNTDPEYRASIEALLNLDSNEIIYIQSVGFLKAKFLQYLLGLIMQSKGELHNIKSVSNEDVYDLLEGTKPVHIKINDDNALDLLENKTSETSTIINYANIAPSLCNHMQSLIQSNLVTNTDVRFFLLYVCKLTRDIGLDVAQSPSFDDNDYDDLSTKIIVHISNIVSLLKLINAYNTVWLDACVKNEILIHVNQLSSQGSNNEGVVDKYNAKTDVIYMDLIKSGMYAKALTTIRATMEDLRRAVDIRKDLLLNPLDIYFGSTEFANKDFIEH